MKLGGRPPRRAPGAKPKAFALAIGGDYRLRARYAPRARPEGNAGLHRKQRIHATGQAGITALCYGCRKGTEEMRPHSVDHNV